MGFAKFMEDNEQLYIERQNDHGNDPTEIFTTQGAAIRGVEGRLKPLLCGTRTSMLVMAD